jgi:hypothetical protein
MTLTRINELREELNQERISYGELAEIDDAAIVAGIVVSDEEMASDVLDKLERLYCFQEMLGV